MLDIQTFKTVLENTPLISIDLCLVCRGEIFLGRRKNEPLINEWFTPGGRIFKDEPWRDCLKRVALTELGLLHDEVSEFRLMGIWDHFYSNSAFSETVSTHYVNLPHYICMDQRPLLKLDNQHSEAGWFNIENVANNSDFHEYIRNYASHLLKQDEGK